MRSEDSHPSGMSIESLRELVGQQMTRVVPELTRDELVRLTDETQYLDHLIRSAVFRVAGRQVEKARIRA